MSDYRIADGFDVANGSMTVLNPQPSSVGLRFTRTTYAADGTPIHEGPYIEAVWNVLGSKTQYQSILTAFGLLSADYNDVTFKGRNEVFDYVRYNGRAIKPVPEEGVEWRRPFPRNITILIRDLETAS
jgi:hypothetical protein